MTFMVCLENQSARFGDRRLCSRESDIVAEQVRSARRNRYLATVNAGLAHQTFKDGRIRQRDPQRPGKLRLQLCNDVLQRARRFRFASRNYAMRSDCFKLFAEPSDQRTRSEILFSLSLGN